MTALGGIEAGGSKWECAVGTGPDDLRAVSTIATTTPGETIGAAADFFEREGPVDALGIGSFGPVDLARGVITTTPKPGWAHTDVAGALGRRLGAPVAFDTDVNAAALGEHRWGAAQGLDTFVYVTVGTGIGGGVLVGGRPLHGLQHPEMGHLRIPHDRDEDPFPGVCPFHGDCWEGLAAGRALEARWGRPAHELGDDAPWTLEARYLALGLLAVSAVVSPQRIVLGGGVLKRPGLLELVQRQLDQLVNGYVAVPELVRPGLGNRSGVLGALALAATVLG
ncbi:MAG TPA: ROK family protein [Gaiellaceae bacterium]|nr:ROK family protein [Gaiellaceae bacterium]